MRLKNLIIVACDMAKCSNFLRKLLVAFGSRAAVYLQVRAFFIPGVFWLINNKDAQLISLRAISLFSFISINLKFIDMFTFFLSSDYLCNRCFISILWGISKQVPPRWPYSNYFIPKCFANFSYSYSFVFEFPSLLILCIETVSNSDLINSFGFNYKIIFWLCKVGQSALTPVFDVDSPQVNKTPRIEICDFNSAYNYNNFLENITIFYFEIHTKVQSTIQQLQSEADLKIKEVIFKIL